MEEPNQTKEILRMRKDLQMLLPSLRLLTQCTNRILRTNRLFRMRKETGSYPSQPPQNLLHCQDEMGRPEYAGNPLKLSVSCFITHRNRMMMMMMMMMTVMMMMMMMMMLMMMMMMMMMMMIMMIMMKMLIKPSLTLFE